MSLKKFIVILLSLLIAGAFVWILNNERTYRSHISEPVDSNSSARINFRVEKGEKISSIAKKLFEENIITSDWAFYRYVKKAELDSKIEAGKFILKRSYTIPEIAEFLTRSRTDEVSVTIREGLTLEQVNDYLADEKIFSKTEFLECAKTCEFPGYFFLEAQASQPPKLEGYLFADTYFIDPETVDPRSFIDRMLNNYALKLDSSLRSEIAATGKSIHDITVMASLIEKEERNDDEKAVVSGILWKRLKLGMPLGVDATIRYATGKWTEPLSLDDLKIKSPYNSRTNTGLPPGPISNFSFASLLAAIRPVESEYLYYLHDDSGKIHYAKTNEEHNENKRKFL